MSTPRERITALRTTRPPGRHGPRRHSEVVDVVVVGGGAVGAATAWHLARTGRDVVVVERGRPAHHRGAPHGALRVFGQNTASDRRTHLTTEALGLWRELERETGAELLRITGGLDHGDPARTAELAARLVAHGVAHRLVDPAAVAARWPGLRVTGPVLHTPGRAGCLHTEQALAALSAAAVGHGARIRHATRAESVTVRGPDLVEVRTSGGVLRARRVVVAAGVDTPALVAGILDLPPLRVTSRPGAHVGRRPDGPSLSAWPTSTHHTASRAVRVLPTTPECAVLDGVDAVDLPEHLAAFLPALDPSRTDLFDRPRTSTADGTFVLDRRGPVVVGAGFADHGSPLAPALGRALAELTTAPTAERQVVGAR